MYKLVYI